MYMVMEFLDETGCAAGLFYSRDEAAEQHSPTIPQQCVVNSASEATLYTLVPAKLDSPSEPYMAFLTEPRLPARWYANLRARAVSLELK